MSSPTVLFDASASAADLARKPLFIGEFGVGGHASYQNETSSTYAFVEQSLDRVVARNVPLSAVWVWEIWSHGDDPMQGSLHPGRSPGEDAMIAALQRADHNLQNTTLTDHI
mmetsp:Transcript_70290/g.165461  ORF Transcript_70290/g.165461 Transcript_70290/m.165461 type:complete len:112 (-) Transcript_70290:383-718(-)